ncbi:MAG: minor capsid protein [Magnetospiraceae bacterium]
MDEYLRLAIRLERLSLAQARLLEADLSAALATVEADLRRRVPDDAPVTYDRLTGFQAQLRDLLDDLRPKIAETVADTIDAVVEVEVENLLSTLTAPDGVPLLAVTTDAILPEALITARAAPFDGQTWSRWGDKLATDLIARINIEVAQAATIGETVPQIRRRLEKVADLSRQSAQRLARTAINDVSTRTRMTTVRNYGRDVVKGWEFVATLDSRTSAVCIGLDRKEFSIDDPAIPRPPRHPNCRSTIVPVLKSYQELGIDLPDPEPGTRASVNGQVPADLTFEQWLRTQPEAFQIEALGSSRYRAWKRGLPIEGFATPDRELTVAELRALYPQKMKGL